jgi:hypothetical protein
MACIPKYLAEAFLDKLKAGEITPQKMIDLKSEGRHKFFAEFMGEENAKNVNALFESKLLLKNQIKGIVNWAKKESGMKPEIKRDIISRAEKMTEILNPKNEDAFLADLASQRLGVNVSMKEAIDISRLAKAVSDAKAKVPEGSPYGSPERMEHGYAMVEFGKYVDKLKHEAADAGILDTIKNPLKMASEAAGITKAMNASLDNSAIFRQGWKAMMTNPVLWAKNAIESFGTIVKTFGGKDVMANSKARIMSGEYYDKAVKAKLAVATIEEDFPVSLPEKIPLFGKVYSASQNAFTVFIHNLRMDIFNKYIKSFEQAGIDTSNKETLTSIGKLVNSLTGRGEMGVFEPASGVINNVFFSARALKGQIDVYTSHLADPKMTFEVKKIAMSNLVKIMGIQASILVLAEQLQPGSTDKDPRSSDFGKIKVGNTRFDVSGGASSLLTLVARIATVSSKSSTTGKIRKIDPVEAIAQFFENKLSPAATSSLALNRGEDRDGRPVNVNSAEGFLNLLNNMFTPIGIKNLVESKDVYDRANLVAIAIADFLGIGTNSYSPNKSK